MELSLTLILFIEILHIHPHRRQCQGDLFLVDRKVHYYVTKKSGLKQVGKEDCYYAIFTHPTDDY